MKSVSQYIGLNYVFGLTVTVGTMRDERERDVDTDSISVDETIIRW